MNPQFRWSSLPEEPLGAAEKLEALAVGSSGGLHHPLDDFGAEWFAVGWRDTGEEWHQAGLY